MVILSIPIGILIGVVLGLVGSGGALMSTPLLMLIAGFNFEDASTSALVVVLTSSLLAFWIRDTDGVSKKIASSAIAWGALGAPMGVWVSHYLPVPESKLILTLLLLLASYLTWTSEKRDHFKRGGPLHPALAALLFIFVGMMTGLTGIGGGYLIVPVLLVALRIEFHTAVATSLVVVVFNALVSLGLRFLQGVHLSAQHWGATLIVVVAALLGTAIGSVYSKRLNRVLVQKLFAVMLVILSAVLIGQFVPALAHI